MLAVVPFLTRFCNYTKCGVTFVQQVPNRESRCPSFTLVPTSGSKTQRYLSQSDRYRFKDISIFFTKISSFVIQRVHDIGIANHNFQVILTASACFTFRCCLNLHARPKNFQHSFFFNCSQSYLVKRRGYHSKIAKFETRLVRSLAANVFPTLSQVEHWPLLAVLSC